MIDQTLQRRLDSVASRFRNLRFWGGLALTWSALACIGALVLGLNRATGWYFGPVLPMMIIGALSAALVGGWLALRSARDYRWVAQRVEAVYPELRACLVTAVEQQPQLPNHQFGYLQSNVIREALYHAYKRPWQRVVPTWRLVLAQAAHALAFVVFLVVTSSLAMYYVPRPTTLAGAVPGDQRSTVRSQIKVTVEPGNAEVERGASLLVIARFQGLLPADASLVYQTAGGEVSRLEMSKSLDDPVFGARIASVDDALTYHVKFAQQQTETYHVTVFEYPKLIRADARLTYPQYTSLEQRLVQDVRHVSAVEGTKLTWIAHLNKPVAKATLTTKDGESFTLAPTTEGPAVYAASLVLDKSRRLELRLVDEQGRANKQPSEFVINVLPNKPPSLKLVQPSHDVEVSPLEELDLKVNVWDDFGLKRYGVTYTLAGQSPQDIVLGRSTPAKQRFDVQHTVAFEELEAEPDQLLSYHFWAEDVAADGNLRRTSSDMFFAEVRHFEEIFRQGQQPPGGESQRQQQSGHAQQAQRLADLQKQIINGTWNVVRREVSATPSPRFAEDVPVLWDSQSTALLQAAALAERLQDLQSRTYINDVQKHMQDALQHLKRAKDESQIDALSPALAAEQAAYQSLLKLRAREHQVIRGRQQSGSASASRSSRAQRQLDQLDLGENENRYEQQRTATPQPDEEEERENRQVLNRLRELARRQDDLNKRMKELQSALEEARTEEQREEIRQQLQRLREEQQQILRDTDELKSRMDQPENQERMADERQQLDRTRENVRQSSEALEQGQVSRAAASGTRAEREFRELRDEFRRRTSGRFNEEMRQMREDAQQLDDTQQQLSNRLAELNSPKRQEKSLRDGGHREQIQEGFQQQKEKLEELLERMKQTVRDAEPVEPLLAEQLYDTYRDTQQQSVDRVLDATNWSLDRGLIGDAVQQERVAGVGIRELREGVERAAKSVLGDEIEALRRAQEELKWLSEKLNEELAQADPASERRDSPDNERAPNEKPSTGGQNPSDRASQPDRRQSAEDQRQPRASESTRRDQPQSPDGQPPEQAGSNQPRQQGGREGGRRGQSSSSNDRMGGLDRLLNDAARAFAPIGGGNFVEWSDRLRDVEEMLDVPELRAEAARIRDRARAIRADSRRHSKPPNWDLVRLNIAQPLVELRDHVQQELLRRTVKDAVVPIDRDPVPPKYAEEVRRYYERLGAGN